MGEMEAARAAFEVKAQAVSDELEKQQQRVEESNLARERRAISSCPAIASKLPRNAGL